MNPYENLQIGQHVVFHDEQQHEIAGTVKARKDDGVYIHYLLELDNGGHYEAKLLKSVE